ncbi:archease, partial [Acidobacteria bacterium AH-259-A15]|nr:archease [Acidobacteria bacterium AH-259-A15]
MPYEFLEDIATADIAFEAWGETLEETFVAAAEATMNVMIETLDSIEPRERREFTIENEALDMLLFNFLQELIFLKDSERLLLRVREAKIDEENGHYRVKVVTQGEHLDPDRHEQRVDVKAVTLHQFCLQKTDRGWVANVI